MQIGADFDKIIFYYGGMNIFSSHSKAMLKNCDCRLQEIMDRAIIEIDFSVLCGFRNEADQNYAFDNGFSRLRWPQSKHNRQPSIAVDIAPYPINWQDTVRFVELSKVIKRIADELFIGIVWGGDFPQIYKTKFEDMPHYELTEVT